MYCSSCGAKLPDGSQFCPSCGARVVEADEAAVPVAAAAGAPAAEPEPAARRTFMEALVDFRRTTLRAVPTFVLAILAVMAAAGVAYAAYRVTRDVVLPAIERVQQGEPAAPAQAGGGSAPAGEEAEPVSAKGEPGNLFQLGEILAMDPKDIPDALGRYGLSEGMDFTGTNLVWSSKGQGSIPRELVEDGMIDESSTSDEQNSYLGNSDLRLVVGRDVSSYYLGSGDPAGGLGETFSSASLKGGAAPNSIGLANIPGMKWLTKEDLTKLAEFCNFGLPTYTYSGTCSWDEAHGNDDNTEFQVSVGYININDKQFYWSIEQTKTQTWPEPVTKIYLVTLDEAERIAVEDSLYTSEEWADAPDRSRALMYAQALTSNELFMQTDGPFAPRINLRNGSLEFSITDDTASGYKWTEDTSRVDLNARHQTPPSAGDLSEGAVVDATKIN